MPSDLIKCHQFLKEKKVFLIIYYLSIAAVIVGFIYSRALLSIGQISIAAIFLIEGDYARKIQRLKENKIGLLLAGLYGMHLLFLINTDDFTYAAEDLRIKLPLLLFPIVFTATDILDKRAFRIALFLFVAIIFSGTIAISINYALHGAEMNDIREASIFISHIRFSLMICLSMVICIYFATKLKGIWPFLLGFLSLYFILYMSYFTYITGLAIAFVLFIFMFFWYIKRSSMQRKVKWGILIIFALFFASTGLYCLKVVEDYYSFSKNKVVADLSKTEIGNNYTQWYEEDVYNIRENGYLVFQNICFKELEEEWNKRSDYKIYYSDKFHDGIDDVLLRFISSKGIPKDGKAIMDLKENEIRAIENGATNYRYINKSNLYVRISNILWQYDIYLSGGNVNGHSLGMRLEFWKTGLRVFKRNFWFGTGTGDIEQEFQMQYELDKSKLNPQWRFRTHNQYISVAATFGVFGFLYFLIVVFYPAYKGRTYFLFMAFSIIFIISMLTEDTIETQIGVTFYAFFNSLLLFQNRPEKV